MDYIVYKPILSIFSNIVFFQFIYTNCNPIVDPSKVYKLRLKDPCCLEKRLNTINNRSDVNKECNDAKKLRKITSIVILLFGI